MAYGKKSGTPFKMKSPLYGTEDEKKDKSFFDTIGAIGRGEKGVGTINTTMSSQEANDKINKRGEYAESNTSEIVQAAKNSTNPRETGGMFTSKGGGGMNNPRSSSTSTNNKGTSTTIGGDVGTVNPVVKEVVKEVVKPAKTNVNADNTSITTSNTAGAGTSGKVIAPTSKSSTGGYLANQIKTGGISLGVNTKMGGASNKPTSTSTTSSASETTYKPMSKRDRIIRRQDIRTKNKGERVGNQIARIRGRQARKGETLAKRDIKRDDSVVNKSYDSTIKASQGKTPNNAMSIAETNLNNFEKGLNSPKPAAATTSAPPKSKASTPKGNKVMQNQSTKVEKSSLGIDKNYKAPKGTVKKPTSGPQTVAGKSISLKPAMSVTQSLTDSQLKAKLSKKPAKNGPKAKSTSKMGGSGGLSRGASTTNTSIKKATGGPRAKKVIVKGGPSEREKAIMSTYNNIRK